MFAFGGLQELLDPESIGDFIRIAAYAVTALLGVIGAVGSLAAGPSKLN
jgi:hypothetical protein